MPYGQPAQLANLTSWTPGNAPKGPRARRSAAVDKALRYVRKCTPETAEFIVSVMRDPEQPIMARLRAAELILNRTIPIKDGGALISLDSERVTSITLNVVSTSEDQSPLEHERSSHDASFGGDQSLVEYEPPGTFTITVGEDE